MNVRDTSDDEFIRCVSSKRQELKFIEKKQKKGLEKADDVGRYIPVLHADIFE